MPRIMNLRVMLIIIVLCFWNTYSAQLADSVRSDDIDTQSLEIVIDSSASHNPIELSKADSTLPSLPPAITDSTTEAHPTPTDSTVTAEKIPQKIENIVNLHVSVDVRIKPDPVIDLSIDEAIDSLLIYNPELNKARLEWLASKDKFTAAFGNFEPALFANYKLETTERPTSMLNQVQNNYSGGIEGLLPTATKYSVNFSLSDLQYRFLDNATKPSVFGGITVTQPLLQGLWFGKPVLDIKAARVEREIALHKYRSALSTKILELQNIYWKLSFAQEKLGFTIQSVEIAEEIVKDSKQLFRAGKISSLEVIEASSELASRQATCSDARKDLTSAENDLKMLIAGKNFLKDTTVHASTRLTISAEDSVNDIHNKSLSIEGVDTIQPDYLQKKYELKKEHIARDYQSNQCMPELNAKSTFGFITSANKTDVAWEKFSDPDSRRKSGTFSAEVELRIPLGLNIKERHLLLAEKRNVQSAEINLQSIRLQIDNYFLVARKRIENIQKNLQNAKVVVEYRETLLNAELVRQKAGKSNYRKIFEIEEDLTKSKQWRLENILDYKSTQAELARLTGTTLLDRKLEFFEKGKAVLEKKLTQTYK